MTRRQVLAEVLAHLEAERYTPSPTKPRLTPRPALEPITDEQAADNLAVLADALSAAPVLAQWREKWSA